ncbi:hypothetical protein KIN20_007079 [Parelaphostrongylus tenuis]|uniref:Uncharacterized protein n=1 Tax=Parelaphostrongylus tenuis TaxID=148309 RepID=A0AAD5MLM3_PARTN|nr:hypothetical protein KIN20_007079 [Parelaphostrongylus tenuis]
MTISRHHKERRETTTRRMGDFNTDAAVVVLEAPPITKLPYTRNPRGVSGRAPERGKEILLLYGELAMVPWIYDPQVVDILAIYETE